MTWLLVGYPLWWALGIADFMWVILAIPMIVRMAAWRNKGGRKIKLPPGFGLWLVFLIIAVAGIAAITLVAPGTVPSLVSRRVLSYGNRMSGYFGVTVVLLYAGNLTERELPRRALAWMLGLVGIVTVAGGVAGMLLPHLQFSSPFLILLPKSVQANPFVQASAHPALTQIQNVLGTPGGRPKAPFDYTNTWSDCLTILVPFLLIRQAWGRTSRQRLIAWGALAVGFVPLLYSLNRGAWIGVMLSVAYLAVRLAARGKRALLGLICAAVVVVGALLVFTPLNHVVTGRIHNGKSNDLRSHLDSLAVTDGLASPVIGYGDTRQEKGSPSSIAVGPSAKCPSCGQLAVGSTGQLWLLLVCNGFVGAFFYLAFFGFGIWRFRRDRTPYGYVGVLVLLLSFWYSIAYDATGAPLGFTMLAFALLWKNDRYLRVTDGGEDESSARVPAWRRPAGRPTGRVRVQAGNGNVMAGNGKVMPGNGAAITAVLPPPVSSPDAGGSAATTAEATRPPEAPAREAGVLASGTEAAPGEPPEDSNEEFLARTLPLPAIDVAGFDSGSAQAYEGRTDLSRRGTSPQPPSDAGLAKVARGSAVNLAGAVISAASSVGLTVLVARNFSQPVVGAFFVATSLFLIVEAVTNLGAFNGAIYFIARFRALQAERRIPAIVRATVIPVIVSSVIGAIAMAVFAHPLARLLLTGRLSDGVSAAGVATSLRVLAIALPFAALTDTFLGASRGYHEMRPTVLVDRIGRSGLQMVAVTLAALAGSSGLLAPLWALPYIPTAVVGLFWLRAIMRRHRTQQAKAHPASPAVAARPGERRDGDSRHSKPNARGFWRFTAPRSVASVAQIIIQRLDIVLVGVMKGPVDAAIYTAATRFLVAGQLGNAALSMSAQPQLTRLFAIGDRISANAVYQATTAWLILLTWPLYLLAAVFGPSILAVFGHSYHAGSTVMVILALSMLVATACGQVDMVLITTGRSTWSLYNGLLAMAVNIGVDVALIPRMGITGAAIGWAAAIALTNLIPLVQVAVAAKVHPFGRGTLAACGLATLSFGLIPLALEKAAGSTGPTVLLAAVVLGCAVLAIGLWPLRTALQLSAMPGLDRIGRFSRRSQAA